MGIKETKSLKGMKMSLIQDYVDFQVKSNPARKGNSVCCNPEYWRSYAEGLTPQKLQSEWNTIQKKERMIKRLLTILEPHLRNLGIWDENLIEGYIWEWRHMSVFDLSYVLRFAKITVSF